jgi:hypothetical protein
MTQHHDERRPIAIPLAELRTMAAAVAEEMKGASDVTGDLRERFIDVRAALFQRGIYDPVLVRFDSIIAPKASTQELAEQLATVAQAI